MRKISTFLVLILLCLFTAKAQTSVTVCQGVPTQLSASGADLYEWLPHDGLDDPYSPTPMAMPSRTTTYVVHKLLVGTDQITNGNFSAGNTGFSTSYTYTPNDSIDIEGRFIITNNPSRHHRAMNPCVDHTSGSLTNGRMMVVNTIPTPNQVIWQQTINVTPNTDYAFSTWVNSGVAPGGSAVLQFSINSQLIGTPFTYNYSYCTWKQFYTTWNSGSQTTATISIVNQNIQREGNDFAIDDIFFQPYSMTSNQTMVNILPAPAAPQVTIDGGTQPCDGATVTISGPAGAPGYLWSDGLVNQSRQVTSSGAFVLKVKGANNCYSFASDSVKITFQPNPTAPTITRTSGTSNQICQGDSVQLTSSVAPGYLWSNGATTQSIWAKAAIAYTVKAQTAGGCQSVSSDAINITYKPRPAAPRITFSRDSVLCQGDSITLTSSVSTNNHWSTGATTRSITVRTAAVYSLYLQSPTSCPGAIRTATISVGGSNVRPTVTASGSLRFCQGGSVTLTSSLPTGNVWSNQATSQSITVSSSGNYTVTATTTCGTSTSEAVVVAVTAPPATPVVSAGGPITFCSGGSVSLTSNYAHGNHWSTGDTSQAITASATASVQVYVVAGGCSSAPAAPIQVTVNPSPAAPTVAFAGSPLICEGQSIVLNATPTDSVVWYVNGTRSATGPTYTVHVSGSYAARRIISGCSSSASALVDITVQALPSQPTILARGTDSLTAAGAGSTYIWTRNGRTLPYTSATIPADSNGTYTAVAVSTAGCRSTVSDGYTFIRTGIASSINHTLQLVPNPATSAFTIQSSSSIINIRMTDMLGRNMGVHANANTVSLQGIPQGNYIVLAIMANGQTATAKLTVQ